MTVRAYPHTQLMVRCPECRTVFAALEAYGGTETNQHGQVTHGWTRCDECATEFNFDTQYKEQT